MLQKNLAKSHVSSRPEVQDAMDLNLIELYYKDVKRFPLLSAKQEMTLAKHIEQHAEGLLKVLLQRPQILDLLFDAFQEVEQGQMRLRALFQGRVSQETLAIKDTQNLPMDEGLIASLRDLLQGLRLLQGRALDSLLQQGRTHPETQAAFEALYTAVKGLRLQPTFLERFMQAFVAALALEPLSEDSLTLKNSFLGAQLLLQGSKNQFINVNIRLVLSIARKYVHRSHRLGFLDLVQEGNIGLMQAVDRFDYRLGYKFSTYATWWIKQTITCALDEHSRLIRVPVHMVETISQLSAVKHVLQAKGLEPTPWQLSEQAQIPLPRVELALRQQEPLSLQASILEDGTELEASVADPEAVDVTDEILHQELKTALAQLLEGLSKREAMVIRMRFGLTDDHAEQTLEAISRHLGVTPERVRQIQKRALDKLGLSHGALSLEGFRS